MIAFRSLLKDESFICSVLLNITITTGNTFNYEGITVNVRWAQRSRTCHSILKVLTLVGNTLSEAPWLSQDLSSLVNPARTYPRVLPASLPSVSEPDRNQGGSLVLPGLELLPVPEPLLNFELETKNGRYSYKPTVVLNWTKDLVLFPTLNGLIDPK